MSPAQLLAFLRVKLTPNTYLLRLSDPADVVKAREEAVRGNFRDHGWKTDHYLYELTPMGQRYTGVSKIGFGD